MKTINSLNEFRNELLKIAATIEEEYTCIRIEIEDDGYIRFYAYINGIGYIEGKTIDNCLENMRQAVFNHSLARIKIDLPIN